jgi:hypothetical protein
MKKLVFLFILLCTISFSYAQSSYSYLGAINRKLGIIVDIRYTDGDNGTYAVSGSYYYIANADAGDLQLEGYYDPNTKELLLTEKNQKGVVTGYFEAYVTENKTIIKGDWVNAARNKKYPLSLKAD